MTQIIEKTRDQQYAEAAVEGFERDLGPFVVAAEATRMPLVFTDAQSPGNPIIFANDSFLELSGYGREEILGQRFTFMIARDSEAGAFSHVADAFRGRPETITVAYRRKDGSAFSAEVVISPVRDKAGVVVEYCASFVDLTRDGLEEERLRRLLDELNHRTQNTLATVQAIAAQTLRGDCSAEVIDAFEGRILALSRAHGLLGREDWVAVSLRDVLCQILRPFGLTDGPSSRVSLEGDDVLLTPKVALTLAMVFHELASNAARFGALADDGAGQVVVDWRVAETPRGDRMSLNWCESGGPPVLPPRQKGFGSRLIKAGLAQELDGSVELDYADDGVICRIEMPLPRTVGE